MVFSLRRSEVRACLSWWLYRVVHDSNDIPQLEDVGRACNLYDSLIYLWALAFVGFAKGVAVAILMW